MQGRAYRGTERRSSSVSFQGRSIRPEDRRSGAHTRRTPAQVSARKSRSRSRKRAIAAAIVIVCVIAAAVFVLLGVKNLKKDSASAQEATVQAPPAEVAYVFYANTYLSLDKDGVVCANNSSRPTGIPEITGIEFNSLSYGNKAEPIERTGLEYLLRIACSLDKHDLTPDRIEYRNRMATIYFGQLRVELGKEDKTDEKLTDLADLIDQIMGDPGTLYMQNGNANNYGYTFRADN